MIGLMFIKKENEFEGTQKRKQPNTLYDINGHRVKDLEARLKI